VTASQGLGPVELDRKNILTSDLYMTIKFTLNSENVYLAIWQN